MKYLVFFILFVGLLSSCKVAKLANRTRVDTPFVALNNGDTIKATKVRAYWGAVHVGKASYDLNDVAAYTEKPTIGRKRIYMVNHEDKKNSLYLQRVTGRMNVFYQSPNNPSTTYQSMNTQSGRMESHRTHEIGNFYVRIGDTGRLVYLTHRNLLNLIPKSEPAYNKLMLNKGKRFAFSMSGIVGLGLVVMGTALATQEKQEYVNGPKSAPTITYPNENLGLMMVGAGFTGMTLSIRHFHCYSKSGRAIMAINKYNEIPRK